MAYVEVGEVTHYFSKKGVAVVKLSGELKIGDTILIKGATTNFQQAVNSMQIQNESIEVGKPGQEIGLLVSDRVREHDKVYKIEGE